MATITESNHPVCSPLSTKNNRESKASKTYISYLLSFISPHRFNFQFSILNSHHPSSSLFNVSQIKSFNS